MAGQPLWLRAVYKVERAVGWRPEIPFEKTLDDTLEYWRQRVSPS